LNSSLINGRLLPTEWYIHNVPSSHQTWRIRLLSSCISLIFIFCFTNEFILFTNCSIFFWRKTMIKTWDL
jgi:hypothetical protein